MEPRRISPEEAKKRIDAGDRVTFLDARAEDAWRNSTEQIPGSIRVPPDAVQAHTRQIPRDGVIVPYCT